VLLVTAHRRAARQPPADHTVDRNDEVEAFARRNITGVIKGRVRHHRVILITASDIRDR
jgi:hypothetical protein